MNVPLFPLNSIVLPRGRIPLQLFEPRYIDMLTRCLKEDRGFVVVLLKEGGEAGRTAAFYDIGTYVRIIDFQQLDNGLLGITVEGESKVSVVRSWQQEDGLNVGDVECLIEEAEREVPERFSELPSVLKALFRHPVIRDLNMDIDYGDARDVGWRLTELLPLDKQEKQKLVELQDPLERLSRLQGLLEALEEG
ncbi:MULTISPECIES: LON peptidase substrate-binding domain-containing protein [Marinobacter]|jgi:Lon protease-like protein|uniref:LON peptidase substrate-binding domain-containing protein n=1 Tax=Marinobacter TaxID=2742 RepID=UPI0007D964EF|nr:MULTISPECIES: LON peptidase substrate-binding domain-containing protein [Marinobacter]MBL3824737.1 LON peptidase substrate-binding domain-containing protein [Marinobacter sp. MC3]MBL3893243.1 LON peptidase substrate-binding domain-containing protein [Marinobacter sp. MW3]MCD1648987.1 LON peptidase substrate-binding domain-containing protein [Marinobacter adhaerens]OAN87388.1 peptidase S16 [Marinobacter sp. EhC06]OAN95226.1 peptidase S16 [Marinobacter sp. EhN04]|eukprot:gnl/TRDRNA2_/TRDRNA2_119372_c2_seq1.p1 gnl/TRDRNA2_/TRDRNA2_119372_c2~~gnl/TRDRNA2_/TRDRNA2_119372_c2_seq1.p1  ORF type:complete len:193 (-),score=32.02 gnl/TRDRNA2_/TRDRNA2_119372_c2_seq1:214-792(-)